ncbi:hypothetical protein LDENG_00023890 [Lucifuga dentata]|nr:hypothetical protein LDENG_00023890 [Lucifuga dentata]
MPLSTSSRSWSSMVLMERIQWMYPSFLKARRCCQDAAVLLKLARCLWGDLCPQHCATL